MLKQITMEQFDNYILKVKSFSKAELLGTAADLFIREKKIGDALLIVLAEIYQRRVYAEMGYSSLFEMLVKHFRLSEASAYQRISLIKLIREVPEAKSALIDGSATISNLVLANSFINDQNKTGQQLTPAEQSEVIERVKDKTHRAAKIELAAMRPQPALPLDKSKPINETQVNLHFTIEKELQNKLEHIKNLIAHKNGNPTMNELLTIMADITIEQLEKKKGFDEKKLQTSSKRCVTNQTETAKPKIRSRYIPKEVRRKVYQRAQGQCQYETPEGKRCECKKFLQFEHTHPFARGGLHEEDSLLLYCAEHNALRAKQEFGKDPREYMQ